MKLKSYCALNPRSHFERGYEVVFGAENNPSWVANRKTGLFTARYLFKVGKAVVDSPGGWVATVNGREGTAFVQLFQYEPGRDYPDGASVEFWHNGLGSFRAWGKENIMPDDPKQNPYIAEAELISPFFQLEPGESCRWNYQWGATRIGGDFPVLDCSSVAAVCSPLKVDILKPGRARISGHWGVFESGSLVGSWLGKDGLVLARFDTGQATPEQPAILQTEQDIPAGAVSLKFEITQDASSKGGCELGRAFVPKK